mmetsp:Transcript_50611/g.126940  ORF Transcript_50611/g.126940 Transcript_50611/m.126940 type:complete len:89 (-) Transcript_50611:3218-3484(-)
MHDTHGSETNDDTTSIDSVANWLTALLTDRQTDRRLTQNAYTQALDSCHHTPSIHSSIHHGTPTAHTELLLSSLDSLEEPPLLEGTSS